MSDCDSTTQQQGPALKSLEEALEIIVSRADAVDELEMVTLTQAYGRVLAHNITNKITMPPWDNSAMDGYAVNTADLAGTNPRLPISQRIPAGSAAAPLAPGTAARIFTGAPVPDNADAVVIQELCKQDGDEVIISKIPQAGANIRRAGEDSREGEIALQAGIRLGPQHIGLAASVGFSQLPVFRRLRVALFSSGDELRKPGETLQPGQIYNSNEYTLNGLLQGIGCEVISLGIVQDTFEATCNALQNAAQQADLIMTSGGVSVGEEDHIKPAVEKLGSLELWKVAIRPGKPLAFGRIDGTPFIGTPGNPVSLFVTFCLFARPFILKSQGLTENITPSPILAKADFDRPERDKRREFARARLWMDEQGETKVTVYHSRSSGLLSSLTWANGLAILPENRSLTRGEPIQFLPYDEILK